MAQRIAMRMKGGTGEPNGQRGAGPQSAPAAGGGSNAGAPSSGGAQWQRGNGNSNAPPDLQRFLGRMPNGALTDLQKGDAVMIVATQGSDPGSVTAITVLGGVEPILTASPNGMGAAALFSGWNMGAPGGEGGPQ
jgi:hypothetical protein